MVNGQRWRRWWDRRRRRWPGERDALRRRLATLTWPPVRHRIAIVGMAATALALPEVLPVDATGVRRVIALALMTVVFAGAVGVGLNNGLYKLGELNRYRGPLRALTLLVLPLAGALAIAWFADPPGGRIPTLLLLLVGAWATVLTHRRLRTARRNRAARICADTLATLFLALAIILRVREDLAATRPAAALLFVPAGWAAVLTWRALGRSRRLVVRAAADIVLSLLLGAILVLGLVWLANMLDLPTAEVATLRAVLSTVDGLVDQPWWLWALLYAFLAAASITLALLPGRLAALRDRWTRYKIPSTVDIARRLANGVHIGLMLTVLIGLAAPAIIAEVDTHVRPKYALELQRQLEAQAAQAAYEQITNTFQAETPPTQIHILADLFTRVHATDHATSGEATAPERSLARRLGLLQSAAVLLDTRTPAPLDPRTELLEPDQFADRTTDAQELTDRLGQVAARQESADTARARVQQAAELAATAIANVVQAPSLGGTELLQIAKEYVQGVVEGSPLKDLLTRWAAKLPAAQPPPAPERQVVPDPGKLLIVAYRVRLRATLYVRFTDPTDPVVQRAEQESPLDAAVDLTNETRYFEEHSGPCTGCPEPIRPGEEPRIGPEHGPGRGPVERPPPIHVR